MLSPLKQIAGACGAKYTIVVILIAYISNLIIGFCFAWSSPVLVKLDGTEDNPLGKPVTSDESDLIGSTFYAGAAIGPLLFVRSTELWGRKPIISVMAVPLIVAYGLLSFVGDLRWYYVCRVLAGVAVGGACGAVPVYASEILPTNLRGSLMSLSNTFNQMGFLVAYSLGSFLTILVFNATIAVLSAIFLVAFACFCPETPYFEMKKNGRAKSEDVLKLLRNRVTVDEELSDIERSVTTDAQRTYLDVFCSRRNLKAFFMATTPLVIQQLTGINMVISYSQLIFKETNVELSSEKCTLIVSALQVCSSLIAPIFSERFNRKSMLIFSLAGLGICNFTLAAYFFILKTIGGWDWLPLITLIAFVMLDNSGNGPLPWVILGEIYPMEIRSVGAGASTSVYFLTQFALTFCFKKIELSFAFFVYGWCCLGGIAFTRFVLAETMGKSLREIQESLENVTCEENTKC